ncbi:hypothetical protein U9M48_023617 [Paspalum notatum var. saurae]|uniref:Uncharacterized protein n=1 Tax=Paspalum notatum var. saurae TaxID=547442 RepID=A0AAQ3TKS2_PASNO
MGSSSSPSPPPPPMIGRAGNLTVFITPPSPASTPRGASRTPPPESPRSDFSTRASQRRAPSPSTSPPASPAAAPALVFTPPPPPDPVMVAPPPVQVPPPQYVKASAGGKHDGSALGFFWDAVARVQEDLGSLAAVVTAHASLDEYVANWFGLDQSKYQWALNDYYEATGKSPGRREQEGSNSIGRSRGGGGGTLVIQRTVRDVGGSAPYPQLTRTNYDTWEVMIKVMLEAHGLLTAV